MSAPKMVCRDLTGADCDVPVAIDAPHCGNPDHVVAPQPVRRAPGRESIPTGQTRPTLTVDEDYDLIDVGWDEDSLPEIDPAQLIVSRAAQKSFTTRHQVLPEVAITEIRRLAAACIERGQVGRRDDGRIDMTLEKFSLLLSEAGTTVIGYWTFHYERTPSQVFSGVASRFGAGRRSGSKHRRALTPEEEQHRRDFLSQIAPGQRCSGVVSSLTNFGAFVDLGGGDGLVHKSELSSAPVDHPSSVVQLGDEIEVQVLDVDLENGRISLSLRAVADEEVVSEQ